MEDPALRDVTDGPADAAEAMHQLHFLEIEKEAVVEEPALVPVHEGGTARLRGTVALVLQKHFGTGSEVLA